MRPSFMALCVCAALSMTGLTAAHAECTQKTLQESDKMRLSEVVCKKGDTSPLQKRQMRGAYYLQDYTVERTFEDGTKEKISGKKGEADILNIDKAYSITFLTDFNAVIVSLK